MRDRQWIYLGPILAAPMAHIAVTSYRHAKTPLQRRLVLGVGILGSTVFSIGMRLALMDHAGNRSLRNKTVVPTSAHHT